MPANPPGSTFPSQERHAGRAIPFSDEELFAVGEQPTLTGERLNEIAFPLGGIGTGCVSLSGRGAPVDWEIFNRPNKSYRPDYTFFHLQAQADGGEAVYRVLEGRLQPPYQGGGHGQQAYRGFGFGPSLAQGAGLLRFADCSFSGRFPFCRVDLADDAVPVRVSLEAWSPFMPLNDEDSSLPVAIFSFSLSNSSSQPVSATVAMGLQNVVGWPDVGGSLNRWVEGDGYRGIAMTTERHAPDAARYGSMALLTPDADVTYQLRFAETSWFAASESLVDEFGATGEFGGPREPLVSPTGQADVAQLGLRVRLAPGEAARRTFVLAWLMPNFEKYWGEECGCGGECSRPTWRTYHGNRWADAESVGRYAIANLGRLESESRRFADTFFASTLPVYVLEAISSQLTTLRSPTVTRLPDGTVYGFEGCHAGAGCCEGSCTHVWGYAQAMAHLFPALERGMRQREYDVSLRPEDGHMQFRLPLPPGRAADHEYHAAADGQMGEVLRVYREWQISGDDDWLRALWPRVKRSLEYAWVEWDRDRDGLLEGIHHNTLDIEYHGPETVCGSMYLAALRAGEAMARHLDDGAAAAGYRDVFERGRANTDERLFNGEYYFQALAEGSEAPYQFGPGCICDQVIGQWHGRMYGLGDILDREHVRSALAALFRHNFRDDFYGHHNPHRVYALNDDKGLVICTWPRGGRPKRSLTYAFECMSGFEYQVGAHLIYEGFLREGLSICKAIRDRHDGRRRNPYNEFECGSHYVRAMANYAYLGALTGFRYSAPERTLYLDPKLNREDGQCFFSVEGAWGTVRWRLEAGEPVVTVEAVQGSLAVERVVWGE
ncbi:MAG: GH116 family glycosyl-hydrolase [Anaerolineae bacterium]